MPTSDAEPTSPSAGPWPGKAHQGSEITVYFDPQRCRHFAECLRGLPEVFNARHRPWIAPDAASAAVVAEVIRRCPSGALHYQAPGIPREQPDVRTTIRAVDRGPFLVRGDLRIHAADGSRDRYPGGTVPVHSQRPPAVLRCCVRGPRTIPGRSPGRTVTVIRPRTPPPPSGAGRRWADAPLVGVSSASGVAGRCCSDRRTCRGRPAGAVHRRSAADLGIRGGRCRSGVRRSRSDHIVSDTPSR